MFRFMKNLRPNVDPRKVLDRLFYNESGQILVSIVFGVALAFMFRKVCKGEHCIVMQPPPLDDIDKYVYKVNNVCYKYSPRVSECVPQN